MDDYEITFPQDIATCHARLHEVTAELARAQQTTAELREQIAALKAKVLDLTQRLFGRKSERQVPAAVPATDDPQSAMPSPPDSAEAGTARPTIAGARRRGQQPGSVGHGRQRHPELPTRVAYRDLPIEERQCEQCGQLYVACGTEDAEQIDWQVRVERVVVRRCRYRKTCACETTTIPHTVTAPPPPKLIPKGLLTVPFVVQMLQMKYVWGVPLYRLVQILGLQGFRVSSGTLTGVLRTVSTLLKPLEDAIRARNRADDYWHADETHWKVFAETAGKIGHRWWLWVFRGTDTTVFLLDPSRSSRVPREHLGLAAADTEPRNAPPRVLLTDFYAAYRVLLGIRHAWCWAHIRRKFLEAGRSVATLTDWSGAWVERIATLYQRERRRQAATPGTAAWAQADVEVREWVAMLQRQWQEELAEATLAPRARKVLATVQRQWAGLTLFVEDPRIPLDNNIAERLLRTPVVGRKNYYGSRSRWSGELAARWWTLWATARQAGLDPQAWLTAYLTACAENGGQPLTDEAVTAFLPWSLSDANQDAWTPSVS